MIEPAPRLGNCCRVAHHAHRSVGLRHDVTGYDGNRLVVYADLEPRGTPIDKLDTALSFDPANSSAHVFGSDVTAVQQTARHVFPLPRVALHHLIGWFETRCGDLLDRVPFHERVLAGNYGSERAHRKVDSRVGNQIGLKLVQIDVQTTGESKGRRYGADGLAYQSVEVFVRRATYLQLILAYSVDGFVVNEKGAVRVL